MCDDNPMVNSDSNNIWDIGTLDDDIWNDFNEEWEKEEKKGEE